MTAQIIDFDSPKVEPKCAFCKTPKSKTEKMVTSATGKSICGKCIEKCKTLMKENPDAISS